MSLKSVRMRTYAHVCVECRIEVCGRGVNLSESLIEGIFGQDGLINADDAICFDVKCEEIESKSMEVSSKFIRIFREG